MWYVNSIIVTGTILSCWIAMAAGFYLIGIAVERVVSKATVHDRMEVDTFWTGVCSSITILLFLQHAFPIGALTIGVLVAVAIFGVSRIRPSGFSGIRVSKSAVGLLVLAAALLWRAANDAAFCVPQPDEYHFLALKWFLKYPFVNGLANLEGRLGFNNSSWLLSAVSVKLLPEYAAFSALHGSMVLVMLMTSVVAIARIQTNYDLVSVYDAVLAIPLLLPLFLYRAQYAAGGISPDLTVALFSWGLIRLWLRMFQSVLDEHSFETLDVFRLGLMAGVITTVKLSAMFLAVAIVLHLVVVASLKGRKSPKTTLKPAPVSGVRWLPLCIGSALLSLAPWIASNIRVSGWLVYPVKITRLDLPWSVSTDVGAWEVKTIQEWAQFHGRMASEVGEAWFGNWIQRLFSIEYLVDFLVPTIMVVVAIAMLGCCRMTDRKYRQIMGAAGLLLAVSIVSWVLTAPAPRFLVGPLWGFATVFVATAIHGIDAPLRVASLGTLGIMSLVCISVQRWQQDSRYDAKSFLTALALQHPAHPSGHFEFPETTVVLEPTTAGQINRIASGSAWHAPLVCTSRPNSDVSRLRMYDARNPGSGFYIESLFR